MRKTMIAVAAALALGTATIASGAMARGPGGGGAHFGGGGGAHFGAGPGIGRGFAGAPGGFALRGPGFAGRGFAGRRFYRGLYGYVPWTGGPYYGYDTCYQWEQVWTPYGWTWQNVWVC